MLLQDKKRHTVKTRRMDKKGISLMIGYILLVSFAIIIGIATYTWIKTYVPAESLECNEGVSLLVKNAEFDSETRELSLTLKNTGKFGIGGIFIHVKNNSNQETEIIDISNTLISGGEIQGNSTWFSLTEENSLLPNDEKTIVFQLDEKTEEPISVRVIPFRHQVFDNKRRFVSCGEARTSQSVRDANALENLIVFTSSVGYSADFSEGSGSTGIERADSLCNSLASNAGLSGTYVAWLSDSSVNAKDRISNGVYVLPGTPLAIVANDINDLLDGSLDREINQDENGEWVGAGVFTGTKSDGTKNDNNCNDWSSTSASLDADRGHCSEVDSRWTEFNTEKCNDKARIFCFEIL